MILCGLKEPLTLRDIQIYGNFSRCGQSHCFGLFMAMKSQANKSQVKANKFQNNQVQSG